MRTPQTVRAYAPRRARGRHVESCDVHGCENGGSLAPNSQSTLVAVISVGGPAADSSTRLARPEGSAAKEGRYLLVGFAQKAVGRLITDARLSSHA